MRIAVSRPTLSTSTGIISVAVPVALCTLALSIRILIGPLTIDDAFITFRYARNIADGLGFVYNAGEHVLGTTTPLYTLIMSAFYTLGIHDLPFAAWLLNAVIDGLTVLTIYYLAGQLGWGTGWRIIVTLLMALSPLTVAYANAGMDTSLFAMLVIGAATADATHRPKLAGFLAGLAVITRPEGLVMAGLILGRHLASRRLPKRGQLIAFIVPVLPWLGFCLWWFGSPIPQSMLAKYANPWHGSTVAVSRALTYPDFPVILIALMLLPGIPLILRQIRRYPERWPMMAFAPILAAGYGFGALRGNFLFEWYILNLVPFTILGVAATLRVIKGRYLRIIPLAVAILAIIAGAARLNLGAPEGPNPVQLRSMVNAYQQGYRGAATYIRPSLNPDDVVALVEIGIFGWECPCRILDLSGLVSPEIVPTEAWESVRTSQPRYAVSFEHFVPEEVQQSAWFRADYVEPVLIPVPHWKSRGVVVFQHK